LGKRWGSMPTKILEVLAEHDTKATFFVVGWTAEQFPDLVKEIVEAGHVIGCHSYLHRKIYTMTPDEFREDTSKAKTILEDIPASRPWVSCPQLFNHQTLSVGAGYPRRTWLYL